MANDPKGSSIAEVAFFGLAVVTGFGMIQVPGFNAAHAMQRLLIIDW